MIRISGFSWPLHPFQIATWLLYCFMELQFYSFLYPLMTNNLYPFLVVKLIILIIFALLSLCALVSVFLACFIDPADPAIVCSVAPAYSNSIYCYICEKSVHETAKHCRYCNKCVIKFDHHCKW